MTSLPVTRDPVFGCELYDGPKDADGYGRVGKRLAHLVADEERHGPIPKGMELDHACRMRSCVADAHLERVTKTENQRRKSWRYRCLRRRCKNGHDLAQTAMVTRWGGRICRTCSRLA